MPRVDPGPVLPDDVAQHAVARGILESPMIWRALLLAALVTAYFFFRPRRRVPTRITPPHSLTTRVVVVAALLGLSAVTWLNSYVGYVRTPHDLGLLLQRGTGWAAGFGSSLAAISAADDQYMSNARQALNNAQGGTRPADRPQGDPYAARMDRTTIPDPAHGVPVTAAQTNVMLPPGYDDPANRNRRYPVVYLIHGYPGGSADDWFTAGDAVNTMHQLLERQLVQPMIIVAPTVSAGVPTTDWECLNVPGGPQLESYLTETVVPRIDARYRTIADRRHRAIAGMSGGGFCALNVGLHHVDEYATMLVTLPYDDPGSAVSLLQGNPALIDANTPRRYIPTMPFPYPVAVMLDAGDHAQTDMTTSRRIAAALTARGQKVSMRFEPGLVHTWRTARAALPFLLAFANEQFTS
ncbi:alpha/beta hydrolase [Gandjariella thermophila]|uniref:Esterase n=1 Tax=Gandjariella thermophila TaxID=1931992 RepID=A0A4D4JEA5_9PSEU|nr:alpha/beta hydrolase-fold protein [Gandjariella thermophila]GDY32183.1 esterase [Gandjariella thermophila]